MPNWTTNKIIIFTPNANSLAEFKSKYFTNGDFDFNKVIPEPQNKEECPKACYINENSHVENDADRPWFDWYKWRNRYWGVKWNASDTFIEAEDEKSMEFTFDTPWGPPDKILYKLMEQNPEIKFMFEFRDEFDDDFHSW